MKATKCRRIAFQLVPRVRPTGEIGGGLLPTVLAVDREHPERVEALAATGAQTIYSRKNGELRPNGLSDALNFHAMVMIPTPQARDWRTGNKLDGKAHQRKTEQGWSVELPTLVSMLPTPATPATRDHKGTNSDEHLDKDRGHHDQLPNALKMNTGLKLQPAFAFWMMGYPEDWTLLPFLLDPNTPPENGGRNPSKPPETPYSPK